MIRACLTSWMLLSVALVPHAVHAQTDATAQRPPFEAVQDTLANPLRLACGHRLDPVGYVLYLGDEIQLTVDQVARLQDLEARTRAQTLPAAAIWRQSKGGLAAMRSAYASASTEIEAILTAEQWERALRPILPKGRGMVRCFSRSHLLIPR